MLTIVFVLAIAASAAARTCHTTADCVSPFACFAGSCLCPPGTFSWESQGLVRCRVCAPGCACPGGFFACGGCSGGLYAPGPGATACSACPPGTTTDMNFNSGCDPLDYSGVCANGKGPIGQVACRPTPPAMNVGYGGQNTTFAPPNGALVVPPQYLAAPAYTTPSYTPGPAPFVPNRAPPFYDVPPPGQAPSPMLDQSY
jgi:hypothetical protein